MGQIITNDAEKESETLIPLQNITIRFKQHGISKKERYKLAAEQMKRFIWANSLTGMRMKEVKNSN